MKTILKITFALVIFVFSVMAYANAEMLKDINPSGDAYPYYLTNVNGTIFFIADDGSSGTELWKSDGTSDGTAMVKDITPGSNGTFLEEFVSFKGMLFFTANDGIKGNELWTSDGTSVGTYMVINLNSSGDAFPKYLTPAGSYLFFAANDGINGEELWRTDGTSAGTTMVQDIHSGTSSGNPSNLVDVGGTLFFTAQNDDGTELWKSDGTPAGTVMVRDINETAAGAGSWPSNLRAIDGVLYFSADNGTSGQELWKSDGTEAGTVMIKDIVAGTGSSNSNHFIAFDGAVFFSVSTGTGYELWKTDGTGSGTVKIKDLNTSTDTNAIWGRFVTVGDLFYFAITDEGIGSFGKELWKSDGTPDGTLVVKDIRPGAEGSDPNYLTEYKGVLYFRADGGINGAELWKSDGTPEGTVMAQDLAPGSSGGNPEYLININGELCFAASDGTNGTELWKFDKPLTVYLKISGNTFDEDGDDIDVSVALNGPAIDAVDIVLSFSGTASEGDDYTPSEKIITIPAGSTEESVKLTGIADDIYEGDEIVVVNIASATNAVADSTQSVSLTIKDEENKPTVTIYSTEKTFDEGGAAIKIEAYMGHRSSKDVVLSLNFGGTATLEGSGVTDADYKASEPVLTIPADGQDGHITLVGKRDDLREGDESVIVTIASASDAEIDTDASVDLTLKDMTLLSSGTYYVDMEKGKDQITNGNSADTGAWKTLHYAISNINQGTPGGNYTLNIVPGVYSIENGEADADITISQSDVSIKGADGVIISGTYDAQDWVNGITIEGSDVTIRDVAVEGFHESGINIIGSQNIIDNCAAYENKIGITLEETAQANIIRNGCELHHNEEAGIIISGGTDNEIYKNHDTIYDNGLITSDGYSSGAGIMILNSAKDNQVYDNHIYSTQTSDASGNTVPKQYIGIYLEDAGDGNRVRDNDIRGHHSGIEIADSNADIMQNRLRDNEKAIYVYAEKDDVTPRIWNNLIYASADGIQHYGIFVGNDEKAKAEPLIYHNTIDRGEEFGIYVNKNTAPKIRYNIISNFQGGIENYEGSPVVEYNNLHGNSINYSGVEGMTGKQGNISHDPQFRNDVPYLPQVTSPCLNGIPTSENDPVGQDLEGTVRPQHSGYDMGCYEYTGYSLHVKISEGVEGEVNYETRCLAGENCPDPDHYRVKIEAKTSSAGYQFDHWEGDLTGSENPAEIILDADKNITAVFLPIQYRVEVFVSPDDGGTVSTCSTTDTSLCDINCPGDCEASYDAGSEITLTAVPASGYQFDHWAMLTTASGVSEIAGASDGLKLTVDSNKHITAVFSPKDSVGSISGYVYQEDGTTFPDISVFASDYETKDWKGSAITDQDGAYHITNLPPGTYRVATSKHFCDDPESYPYVGAAYDYARNYDSADPVTVTAFNTTSGIDLFVWLIEKRESLENAIEDGLAWLAVTQNADGSWGSSHTLAKTGLAVLTLEKYATDKGYSPLDAASPYHEQIAEGLSYIFSNAYETAISDQPAGNPDGDGDGMGVFFDAITDGASHSHVIYNTGIAMMAIAGSNSPDATVNLPGPLDQKTYREVLQNAVDYLAWAQTDPGDDNRGGWNYEPMDNKGDQSDQSNSGWATLGLAYAEERFGISIPEFVKTELSVWIDFIQDDADGDDNDGGAYYATDLADGVSTLRTGHLLKQMAFVGDQSDTPRVQAAVAYLNRHWNDTEFDPGWRGCLTCYHATYSIMTGLAGLDISLLDSTDWFQDFTETLMAEQTSEGGWSVSCFDDSGELSTAWALLTLQRASLPPAVRHSLTLTISPENGGKVAGPEVDCPEDCGGGYVSGTEVPLEAFPEDGYEFAGWKWEEDGVIQEDTTNPITFSMNSDKSITAYFEPIVIPQYSLNLLISPAGGGSISTDEITCVSDCTKLYDAGSDVAIQAKPKDDYKFLNWTWTDANGDIQTETNASLTIAMNSDKAISAHFAPIMIQEYSLLTLLISPPEGGSVSLNGTTCVSACTEVYESGTNLRLEALPEEGYQFSGWKFEQDGVILENGSNPISISMSSDKAVEASFEPTTSPRQYLLSLSVSPDETWGSISLNGATCPESCNFLYESGSLVTLTATPAEGYQFSNWEENITSTEGYPSSSWEWDITSTEGYPSGNWEGDTSGVSNSLTFVMDANKAVKAVFTPEPDSTSPSVDSTIPSDGESDVSLDTSVTAFFTEPMNASTLTEDTFSMSDSLGNKVSGSLVYDEEKMAMVFTPDTLPGSKFYTVVIGTAASDSAGNALQSEYQWSFRTVGEPDIMPPEIRSTQPVDGALTSPDITIHAMFSEPVNTSTLSAATFFVSDDSGNRVDGSVSYDEANASAIFTPAALTYSTTYTVTISTDVEDLAGNSLQADYHWSFDTISPSDITSPRLKSVFPADGAIRVSPDAHISAVFSESVNPSSISTDTFLIFTSSDDSVEGSLTYDDAEMKAVFIPTSLDYDTTYTVVITDQVRDIAGNTLAEDYQWGFTTASEPAPPYVMFTDPADTAMGVAADVSVKAVFSEPMNAATLTEDTFILSDGVNDIPGSISYGDNTAIFTPDAALAYNTTYTAVIRASAEDVAGNPMEKDYHWSFSTFFGDVTSPTVTATLPLYDATDVPVDISVNVTFSEAMTPDRLTTDTFYLTDASERIPGTVAYSGTVATFTPDADLAYETSYQAVITTDAEDLAGNPMEADFIWSFTTAALNHSPTNPYAIRPDNEEWFDETTVLLRASAFSDPENDQHIETHWQIRRADRMYNYHDYDATFNYMETSSDLTEHVVSGLIPGMKYMWKVGYKDAGSQTFSWSQEYAFKAGVPETNADLKIPSGTALADFRMISFLQYPDNPLSLEVLANDMGGSYDREKFRIGTYDPRTGGYVECGEGMQIEPGKAYWFLARNGLDVTVSGVPVTLSHDVDVRLHYDPVSKNGWNMIAGPNNAEYDWHDVQVLVYDTEDGKIIYGPVSIADLPDTNDFIDRKLWQWDDGDYHSGTRLMEPMSGYWVRVKQGNVFLRFPKDAHASGIASVSSFLRTLSPARWSLTRSAIADDGDSPPMPIGDFSSKDSGGGGCFISTICPLW